MAQRRSGRVVGNTVGGALIGAFVGYKFLPGYIAIDTVKSIAGLVGLSIDQASAPLFLGALGVVGGGLLGLVGGRARRKEMSQRAEAFARTAAGLKGGQSAGRVAPQSATGRMVGSASSDAGDLAKVLTKFFPPDPIAAPLEVQNVIRPDVGGITVAIADIEYYHRNTGTVRQYDNTIVQTVACYESGVERFPDFAIQPGGLLAKVLTRVAGIEDLDFPTHPGFSDAYHVSSSTPPQARAVLAHTPLLDALSRTRGLSISAQGRDVVLYRLRELCDSAELVRFTSEAAEIFRLVEEGARAAEAKGLLAPGA